MVKDLTQPITKGGRNDTLTSIAGTLRQKGLPSESIEQALLAINQSQCDPPLEASEVHTIAFSIGRYAVVPEKKFTIGGQDPTLPQAASTAPVHVAPTVEPVAIKKPPYPVFPDWVMNGTSVYEGFVKPVCDVNSRYPEFMFMPALLMLMNYIGGRVRIAEDFTIDGQLVKRDLITSLFLVMIGRKGRVIKSSSAKDTVNYFKAANMADWASPHMKTGNSKSLVWSAGSPEGLGLDMARLACNNGVLFYDELARLTKKAGIECSTLQDALLTLYESDFFANQTKRKNEAYSLPPGSDCASLIACTTDKNFHTHWSKLAGDSSGLDERFFFLYQPSVFKDMVPRVTVNTAAGAAVTRQRVDVALNKGVYRIVDSSPFKAAINELGNRSEIRAEKFALAFAVDLGRDEIDQDCVERGLALSKYELAVKNWLKTFESTTREGDLQQQILHKLRQEGAVITVRKLENDLRAASHGTSLWSQAFNGLIKAGWTAMRGSGKRGSPYELVLIREPDYEESEDATD